ncbi:MAG: carboxypeptidase regulatory-like domain-containing protein [Deltaproteobacteria bacterium]|nr:carboxypeptidase regulatory-like domain-containing protein [Deltaproteobacteria bacterium]
MSRHTWKWALLVAVAMAATGCAGSDGAAGADGKTGPAGSSGPQGPVGPAGSSGPAGEAGPKGDKGDKGDPGGGGEAGVQTGTITGTVKDFDTSAPIQGANVSAGSNPAVQTDAIGAFTLSDLPIGGYTLKIVAADYADGSAVVGVSAGQTSNVDILLKKGTPSNLPPTVTLAGKTNAGFSSPVELAAVATDPENDALTYTWTLASGPTVTLTPNNEKVTFTTSKLTDFVTLEDRPGLVPLSTDSAGAWSIKVTVDDGHGNKVSATASVSAAPPALGIRTIPLNAPQYLNSGHDGTNAWTCTRADSKTCVLTGASTRTPMLMPDGETKYTLKEGTTTLEVWAGRWSGIIGQESNCTGCHTQGSMAPDMFTPWAQTGHAKSFSRGIDGEVIENGKPFFLPMCISCHSVGYDTAADNSGFDDVAKAKSWTLPTDLKAGNWDAMKQSYPQVAQLANVQCENCHGPQINGTHMKGMTSEFENERVTFGAGVCLRCHDAGTHHLFGDQWKASGHSNDSLAREEATWESRGTTSGHCGRCHSGQGFVVWQSTLNAGAPGPFAVPDQATATKYGLTDALVQPQTCATCHDPHDATNPAQLRVFGHTALLPSGFQVDGAGAGALCQTCHNTRNGVAPTTGTYANCAGTAKTYLHEQGDPCGDHAAGPASSYSAPHSYAAQGDVFNGRNAYFAGVVGTPHLSKHANVTDTCVGCHMQNNPTGLHSFRIDPAKKGELCGKCHGSTDGEGLKAEVEDLLGQLTAKIGGAVQSKIVADSYVIAWDEVTDCYSSVVTSGTAPSNIVISPANIASITLVEVHGQAGLNINLKTAVTAVPLKKVSGGAVVNCTPATKDMSVVVAQLGSLKDGNTGAALNLVSKTDPIVKASWNYFLFEGDASFGVHNPSFVTSTIWNTIQALP